MKKSVLLLTIGMCACAEQNQIDLAGCWMEILPQNTFYQQGVCLNSDGTAQSIGMATLQYHDWKQSDNQLIINGESIGNGQSIPFSDTLTIVNLVNDTLTVQQNGGRSISFVRVNAPETVADQIASRPAYEGFEWTELCGAGLKLNLQKNDHIRLLADPSLPGIVMVRDQDLTPKMLIQIFDLKNQNIDDVILALESTDGWDKKQTCTFKEVASGRPGVRRYVMVPDGQYGVEINKQMQTEPVPATCNGWGVGNSGSRYFEIHENHPDKAVFVEIGQDAPLFDENSIEFTAQRVFDPSSDILYTMSGTVRIGHEVRSFQPANSDEEFWLVDKTGTLNAMYDELTGGVKNGKPVEATLRLEYNGKWDDGFAAEYSGVYFVREVISLK